VKESPYPGIGGDDRERTKDGAFPNFIIVHADAIQGADRERRRATGDEIPGDFLSGLIVGYRDIEIFLLDEAPGIPRFSAPGARSPAGYPHDPQ